MSNTSLQKFLCIKSFRIIFPKICILSSCLFSYLKWQFSGEIVFSWNITLHPAMLFLTQSHLCRPLKHLPLGFHVFTPSLSKILMAFYIWNFLDTQVSLAPMSNITSMNRHITSRNRHITSMNQDITSRNQDITPRNQDITSMNRDITAAVLHCNGSGISSTAITEVVSVSGRLTWGSIHNRWDVLHPKYNGKRQFYMTFLLFSFLK